MFRVSVHHRLLAPTGGAAPAAFHPWVTALCAILLAAMIIYLVVLSHASTNLASLRFPGESAGRILDRHLEFYEGYASVPSWQRGLFAVLFGERDKVQADVIRSYREVLGYFRQQPKDATPWALFNTRARLLVSLAESGRKAQLEAELRRPNGSLDDDMLRDAVRFAYSGDAGNASVADIFYGVRLFPLGWAADRIDLRVSQRLGYRDRERSVQRRLLANGRRWRDRVLLLVAAVVGVLVLGAWFWWRGVPNRTHAWYAAALHRPWSAGEGFAVLVRVGLLGMLISAALHIFAGAYFQPGVFMLWSTLFASLPMVWLTHRWLLRPRGWSFATAFGLTLRGMPWTNVIKFALAILSLEWAGTLVIAWLGWQFGLTAHWSAGLQERAIFGPWQTAALGGVNLVLWAPLFEELGFRGLVYGSLRARLNPRAAIVASAVLFSALHLYSMIGFLSVFWSGVVLAYSYERFRSLLPGMLVHSTGNLLAMNTVLLFYR